MAIDKTQYLSAGYYAVQCVDASSPLPKQTNNTCSFAASLNPHSMAGIGPFAKGCKLTKATYLSGNKFVPFFQTGFNANEPATCEDPLLP